MDILTNEEKDRTCSIVVPNNQLSLAIGNRGQNAKLAAKLTGFKIDIKPEFEIVPTDVTNEMPAAETDELAELEQASEMTELEAASELGRLDGEAAFEE